MYIYIYYVYYVLCVSVYYVLCALCIIYCAKEKELNESNHVIFSISFSQKAAFHRMNIRIYECLEFSNLASNFHEI